MTEGATEGNGVVGTGVGALVLLGVLVLGALVDLGALVHLGALVVLGALLAFGAAVADGALVAFGAVVADGPLVDLGALVADGALVSTQLTELLKLLAIALLRATATDVPETNNTAATVKQARRILLRFLA